MFFVLCFCSISQIPDSYADVPDECSMVGITKDETIEIYESEKKCLFTKPGFFFGHGLILEIYWQDVANARGFKHLGPTKHGTIVNVEAEAVYVVITSPINQTVKYFPSSALSKTTISNGGMKSQYNVYFSTKNVSNYNITMKYQTNETATSYEYNYLLVLGENVVISDIMTKDINDFNPNEDPGGSQKATTKISSESSLSYISFGTIPIISSNRRQYTIENKVSATFNPIPGVPGFAGYIRQSPSLLSISDVDSSYSESDGNTTTRSPTLTDPNKKKDDLTEVILYLIGGVIALLAIVAIISIVIIIKKKSRQKVSAAEQEYSGAEYSSSYSYDLSYSKGEQVNSGEKEIAYEIYSSSIDDDKEMSQSNVQPPKEP